MKEFMSHTSSLKITTERIGDMTVTKITAPHLVREMILEPIVAGYGVSKCHPKDNYDFEIGKNLSEARALLNIAQRYERQGIGLVKHNENMRAQKKIQKSHRKAQLLNIEITKIKQNEIETCKACGRPKNHTPTIVQYCHICDSQYYGKTELEQYYRSTIAE